MDGNNKITLFFNLGRPLNLVLDIPNQHIYWSDENTGKIERGNLDGTGQTDVVTGLGMPIGLAILLESSNSPPTDLNTIAPLTIAENQPVGAVVGQFNATDPEVQASINSMRAQVERITIGGSYRRR